MRMKGESDPFGGDAQERRRWLWVGKQPFFFSLKGETKGNGCNPFAEKTQKLKKHLLSPNFDCLVFSASGLY